MKDEQTVGRALQHLRDCLVPAELYGNAEQRGVLMACIDVLAWVAGEESRFTKTFGELESVDEQRREAEKKA